MKQFFSLEWHEKDDYLMIEPCNVIFFYLALVTYISIKGLYTNYV